jgi:hypothetical protein
MMAREFQSHIDDLMEESELNDLKREISDVPRPKIMDEIDGELMSGQMPRKPLATEPAKPGQAPVAPAAADGVAVDAVKVDPVAGPGAPVAATGESDPSRAA